MPKSYYDRCLAWHGIEDLTHLPDDLRKYHELTIWCFRHYGREFEIADELPWLRDAVDEYGPALPASAIVGTVDIVDVVRDSDSEFAKPDYYHWILERPVLFEKPVWPVTGKVRLFNYEIEEVGV